MTKEKLENAEKDTKTSAESEELTAKPPLEAQKRSPLLMIVSVVVVAALIGTAFAVILMGAKADTPHLEVTISPSTVSMANGTSVRLYAYVIFKNSTDDLFPVNITNSVSVAITMKWQAGNPNLGDLTSGLTGISKFWQFKSDMEGTSAINWSFKYRDPINRVDYFANKSTPVTIRPAELDYINILPPDRMMLINTSAKFIAESYLTNGLQVNASYEWGMDNSSLGNLTNTAGYMTNFTAAGVGMLGNLTCTGTYAGKSASTNAPITIIPRFPDAETHSLVYDVCAVPLKPYWKDRYQESVLSWTYPVAYSWLGQAPAGDNWIYSNYRINVSAKNITKANTYDDPVYVPVTNPNPLIRGGNIQIDWIAGYIDGNEVKRSNYSESVTMYYDSWFFRTNGTVTMDKVAAKMVLNMTDTEFNNFADWKETKFAGFKTKLSNFFINGMNIVTPIVWAYTVDGSTLFENFDIDKVGDTIVLKIVDYLSYGFESLLGRWWKATFLSFEGWPDDIHFKADIGPLWSDFSLDADFEYSLLAKTSTRGGQSCWVWENTHADAQTDPGAYTEQDPTNGKWYNTSSEITPYTTTTGYWNFLVANFFYNSLQPYTYTPWAWNLAKNDTWSIVWPSGAGAKGYVEAGTGIYTSTVTGHLDPIWIEPLPGEVTSNMKIDWSANRIDMTGPFDGLNWSKNSQGAQEVRDNWSRIGMLPRGVPFIEFGVNSVAESAHNPITALSMRTTTQYTHDASHNFYTHYVTLNQSISMFSAGYNIGGSITNYTWDFGDGNHSYTASTSHLWDGSDRQVNVTLTTTNNYGKTSTDRLKVNLTSNVPPVAAFIMSSTTQYGVTQLVTSFNASGSSDPNGHVTKYWWSFGDGTFASSTSPLMTHQYSKMGNFNIFLNVTDNGTSKSGPINSTNPCIFTLGIQTQVCAKIVMPDAATVGTSVALSGSKSFSFNASRTITNYTWDFGDGGQGWGLSPTHTWTSVGTYTVTLKVKDSIGAWSPNMTSRIHIGSAAVAGLSMTLSRHSAFPGESLTLTIKAVDGAGKFVPTADLYVNVSGNLTGWTGLPLVNYHITSGMATISGISCTRIGPQNITAIKYWNPSINGSEFVTIANRTVEITVYGLGQMPLGSDVDVYSSKNLTRAYWNPLWRGKWGDYPLRYGAMALNEYISGFQKTGSNIDTTDYVHVEARNLPEVNMTNPTFFPRLNASAGGHVSFDWSYHYLNYTEFWYWNANPSPDPVQLPQNPYTNRLYDRVNFGAPLQFSMYGYAKSSYDGWEAWQAISITMDESAAYQLLRMPSSAFTTDPVAWWDTIDPGLGESKNMTVQRLWEGGSSNPPGFMASEGGGGSPVKAGRLDIKSCDDSYSWTQGFWGSIYRLVNNGDGTITMTIDRVGYGEDTLLARWLYWGGVANGWNYPNGTPKGIVPWEPYYDRFSMSGDIDSTSADITLDAGNIYAWRAQKSGDPNVPADTAVWRWEQLRIDYAPTTWVGTCNRSEMDLWVDAGVTFDSWDPAGTAWGRMGYTPDQSPNVIYLDAGESLIVQRPRTAVSGILPGPLVGDANQINDRIASGYDNWIQIQEKWGNATVHPLGCYPGTAVVDKGTGDLKIVGPFVPKIEYYTTPSWLWTSSAPLIEYWIQ